MLYLIGYFLIAHIVAFFALRRGYKHPGLLFYPPLVISGLLYTLLDWFFNPPQKL